MVVEAMIFSIMLIPTLIFYQSKPPTPPGPTSAFDNHYTYTESL
jgi:hypothetical protein